ncbi:unnamed protein product [Clonostachys rosea]|uniref:FAD-binding FR-type domain-containing protein n=1 Tax=Bionectria ochroleuca TaxID=29856 RepID=A0ABY6U9N8_BIOOC|nr:unnamed protein product [Clonostachys rosea]
MAEEAIRQAFPTGQHPVQSSDDVQYLNDDEVEQFIQDLDHNDDGFIDYKEVERKLDQAHQELVAKPLAHHIIKRGHDSHDRDARHVFLRGMMGSDADRISRQDFAGIVRQWNVPSFKQVKKEEEAEKAYFRRRPGWRRIRAYWVVHGPEVAFLALVISMQIAFGVWQLVKYSTTPKYKAAFGWGAVMAKTCAGALYPTFFFLILSMSRYLSTALRRSYYISRFINWDLSQEFHIRISCVAILLATLHALGHLTGSFVHGSDPANEQGVANVLGSDSVPRSYIDYIRSLPGFTGLTGLGLMYVLSLLSIPQVRRWNYEIFQLGHLLMFPIIGLMMAHGTAHLLQWPMFGYFLAFPTLLVLVERAIRIILGFYTISARLKVLDEEAVEVTAVIPSERLWKYRAGQYIFVQVPKISFFQWHPFTVSSCHGKEMTIHIKTDGNWTRRLRELGDASGESEIRIGINGPFGAPAQRFYDFNYSVIIGAGIGVTPFSGILADLQHKDDFDHGGPSAPTGHPASSNGILPGMGVGHADAKNDGPAGNDCTDDYADDYRRVDFHWMVREKKYLLWISDLLNEVSVSQSWHRDNERRRHLEIRLNTHVTAKSKSVVTHVYRWLLEMHRTKEHPVSPLTGLLNPTHFGRPDFDRILDEHYEEMREHQLRMRKKESESSSGPGEEVGKELRVGIFYCGAPVVGEILADKCHELTTRGRHDGSKIEYHFMIEVFG